MILQYEGIFFVTWLVRLILFCQIAHYQFKLRYLLLLPFLFTIIEYFRYDIVFWSEILFLPIVAIVIKYKQRWTWLQYFFYSFFTIVIDDVITKVLYSYIQYAFQLSADELEAYLWIDWVPTVLLLPLYVVFFKLVRFDINYLYEGLRSKKLSRVISYFNITLIFYSICMYVLSSLSTLEYEGWFSTNLDDLYYRRMLLYSYIPVFLGFLFYIQYVVKENINFENQKVKDDQIVSMSKYSNHIESLYKEIRSFRHDYTNLLTSLNEAIKNKDIKGIERIYNSVLLGSDRQFSSSKYDIANLSNLKNQAMKSIISAKMIEAQNRGINLSVEIESIIDIPEVIPIIDFLKIISIFLDNAIEATIESEKPYISFVYFQDGPRTIMIVENSTKMKKIDTKSIFVYGNSSKGNDRGIGLATVYDILSTNKRANLMTLSDNFLFTQELVFE